MNSKLAEELGAARKEIEVLKGRLKELEVCMFVYYEDYCLEDYHYVIQS